MKVNIVHIYSTARNTCTYQQNAYSELSDRATPLNLGVKIPASSQHTHTG